MISAFQTHEFDPFYNPDSNVLVLGSFPSVKSREQAFYYGHPQNRFWKLMAKIFNEETPITLDSKREFLTKNKIAVWDVIESCEIEGSSDSSIKNETPCNLPLIMDSCDIKRILLNGGLAFKLYEKYWSDRDWNYFKLPSTSPANAAWNLDRLYEAWSVHFKD